MVSPRSHFIHFLLLLGSQCIQLVKCAPVRDSNGREDVVAGSQKGFVLSQTGIHCSIPFEFREKIPLDDQPHSKLGLSKKDLQTYHSKNVPAQIPKRLENLRYHTKRADFARGDRDGSLHSCNLKYQYGCLCFGSTKSQQGYENPKLQVQASTQEISVEENQLEVHINGRFDAFHQDEHFLGAGSADIDAICQWYAISIDEKTSQVQGNGFKELHSLSNESPCSPQVTKVPLELPSSSQKHKMKRDIGTPSFVNSSTTTTSLKAPPVAGPTIAIANTSRNKTNSPPSPLEAANNSSALEPRSVGDIGVPGLAIRSSGLSLTTLHGLSDFFEERLNRLPTVDPDRPPPLPPRPVPNPIPPPLPPRPNVAQTFEIVDPQQPEEAPIVLEGPEPPEYHNEMLPGYAAQDPGAVLADGAAPPGYVFQDPEAETRRRRSHPLS
ncbi:hypothetical protein TWF173_006327 [Orbilia oligospora]|nr:hypothetical protein TWF173_006327 [Orbilia oligospora]